MRLIKTLESDPIKDKHIDPKYTGQLNPNRYLLGKYEDHKPAARSLRYESKPRVTIHRPFRTDFTMHPEWLTTWDELTTNPVTWTRFKGTVSRHGRHRAQARVNFNFCALTVTKSARSIVNLLQSLQSSSPWHINFTAWEPRRDVFLLVTIVIFTPHVTSHMPSASTLSLKTPNFFRIFGVIL